MKYNPKCCEEIEKSMPEGLVEAALLVENWMKRQNVDTFMGLRLRCLSKSLVGELLKDF